MILLAGASGCTNRIAVAGFGEIPPAAQMPAYRLVEARQDADQPLAAPLGDALDAALARNGLHRSETARHDVEAGFAIRPADVSLENDMAAARAFRPFCRRQIFALSLLVSDRSTGEILAERQATAMRCRWDAGEAISQLADAAVHKPVPPRLRTDRLAAIE